MRITPRTMLCGTAFGVDIHVARARFEELEQLCAATGDKASLAIAMAGLVMEHAYQARMQPASQLASEAMALIESLADPALTVGLSFAVIYAKLQSAEWSTCCGGHSGSSTWPTETRPWAASFSDPWWRSPLATRAVPATAWVVLGGETTCSRPSPWPAMPTPCHTPGLSHTSTSWEYRMACYGR